MTVQAICPDCDKNYRVPHPRKSWHCKVCDGVLVLNPVAYEDALDAQAEEDREELKHNPFDGHHHDADAAHDELVVAREIREEIGAIKVMRSLLIFNLVLGIGWAVIAFTTRAADATGLGQEFILASVSSAVILVMILIIERFPLPCSLSMLVLTVAAGAYYGIEGHQETAIFSSFFALAYAWVVFGAFKLWKLAKDHPAIYQYVLTHRAERRRHSYQPPE